MITNAIRYDLRNLAGVDHEIDYEVAEDLEIKAKLTIDPAGENNKIKYVAAIEGPAGNDISVEYHDPGIADAELSLAITGAAIVVSLATDENKKITTMAEILASLINMEAGSIVRAIAMVIGIVPAIQATNLTGGDADQISIPVWNTLKLGTQKTLAQYRAIGQTQAFIDWNEDYTVRYKKLRRKLKEWFKEEEQEAMLRLIAAMNSSSLQSVQAKIPRVIIDTIPEP